MLTAEDLGLHRYQLRHVDTGAVFHVQATTEAKAFARFVAIYFRSSAMKPARAEYTITKV